VFQLYQLGAWMSGTVTDATSGAATAPAQGLTNTNKAGSFTTSVSGSDRAGNRTTRLCGYTVVIPTCFGLTPTRVGTAVNDVISGTAGRDVIVGMAGADTITPTCVRGEVRMSSLRALGWKRATGLEPATFSLEG
jgi:hypothetical protein